MTTKIEWTQAPGFKGETWNPTTGCTRVSAGCDHCYAVPMTRRLAGMGKKKYQGLVGKHKGHFNGVVKCHEDALEIPLRWRKPRMVFVNSMSDLFHRDVPFEFIDKVFAVMALCPQHTFQVLTKRPERMAEYLCDQFRMVSVMGCCPPRGADVHVQDWPLPNVWLGTSVENQEQLNKRLHHIMDCPTAVTFLSVEPLLGRVHIPEVFLNPLRPPHGKVDLPWVIVGGESGPGARLCDIAWIRSIRDQCKAAGVPCFVKQIGARPRITRDEVASRAWNDAWQNEDGDWFACLRDRKGGDMSEWPEDLRVREWPAVGR